MKKLQVTWSNKRQTEDSCPAPN